MSIETENRENKINETKETQETEGGLIRYSKVISNKNFIIGRIYNLTSDVTELRIMLKKYESVKKGYSLDLIEFESVGSEEGKQAYENKKSIKELNKKIEANDEILEKTESILENKEELVERYQLELEESQEYEIPTPVK